MKTAIIYMTKHGCTETCVNKLTEYLGSDASVFNLKDRRSIPIEDYDTIIIGGSIHAGKIQRAIKGFCQVYQDTLLEKKLGLFLCCMEEGENAQKQFNDAFYPSLRNHAKAKGLFGGAFYLERMNLVERAIIKKLAKVTENQIKISEEAIAQFAKEIQS